MKISRRVRKAVVRRYPAHARFARLSAPLQQLLLTFASFSALFLFLGSFFFYYPPSCGKRKPSFFFHYCVVVCRLPLLLSRDDAGPFLLFFTSLSLLEKLFFNFSLFDGCRARGFFRVESFLFSRASVGEYLAKMANSAEIEM